MLEAMTRRFVFVPHFRGATNFLRFHLSYTPQPPTQVVAMLIG